MGRGLATAILGILTAWHKIPDDASPAWVDLGRQVRLQFVMSFREFKSPLQNPGERPRRIFEAGDLSLTHWAATVGKQACFELSWQSPRADPCFRGEQMVLRNFASDPVPQLYSVDDSRAGYGHAQSAVLKPSSLVQGLGTMQTAFDGVAETLPTDIKVQVAGAFELFRLRAARAERGLVSQDSVSPDR